MQGGTTFYFVTGGIHEALDRAREAANGRDVRIGGGPSTIQQYLRAGLIDELHLAISPILLGRGERLFEGVDARPGIRMCSVRRVRKGDPRGTAAPGYPGRPTTEWAIRRQLTAARPES
jgi:dihydrofolate reductase